jgi:acyl carrier protein
LEYIGRIYDQVKVRGFRVELGEIEAAVEAHASVIQCVAVVREEHGGEKRLTAYVVERPGAEVDVSRLREQLRERLPGYMVPAAFVILEELPLTPNGKVDRKRLPAPQLNRNQLSQSFSPPRTEVERQIAAIWSEVLQIEKVGIDDNFFDLGGHSLMLLQAHGELRDKLQSDLSLMEMFQFPTIHALAARLTNQEPAAGNHGKSDAESLQRLTEGKNRLRQQYRQRQVAVEM